MVPGFRSRPSPIGDQLRLKGVRLASAKLEPTGSNHEAAVDADDLAGHV
jgi:hypothetical protein